MTPCCSFSLFEKGSSIADTAKDAYSLNDFGYLSDVNFQWKFVDGMEGPMAVYKFDQLWAGSDGALSPLPNNGKERYIDGVTHHPLSPSHKHFVATTSEHVKGEWLGHILIYELGKNWALKHRITPNEYARPIQFIDDDRVLMLHERKLSLMDVTTGQMNDILFAKFGIYSNAHISLDGECVAAVAARRHGVQPRGIDMVNLQSTQTGRLKFGKNRFVLSKPEWMANRTVPIRVHNGMVTLTTEFAV